MSNISEINYESFPTHYIKFQCCTLGHQTDLESSSSKTLTELLDFLLPILSFSELDGQMI